MAPGRSPGPRRAAAARVVPCSLRTTGRMGRGGGATNDSPGQDTHLRRPLDPAADQPSMGPVYQPCQARWWLHTQDSE